MSKCHNMDTVAAACAALVYQHVQARFVHAQWESELELEKSLQEQRQEVGALQEVGEQLEGGTLEQGAEQEEQDQEEESQDYDGPGGQQYFRNSLQDALETPRRLTLRSQHAALMPYRKALSVLAAQDWQSCKFWVSVVPPINAL